MTIENSEIFEEMQTICTANFKIYVDKVFRNTENSEIHARKSRKFGNL